MDSEASHSRNRWLELDDIVGDDYDARYVAREQAGENVHGEADFVASYRPHWALDAGCGTGRVATELARRNIGVVGVDIDPRMLETARRKAPDIEWREGDIASIQLNRRFDAIVMAGNVILFVDPGSEGAVLRNMARHLRPKGVLIAGFQLGSGDLSLQEYDRLADEAGLRLWSRYATWGREPWTPDSDYAVSVHYLKKPQYKRPLNMKDLLARKRRSRREVQGSKFKVQSSSSDLEL